MKVKAQLPPEQNPEKPKSRFRLEITRHNHQVVITDSVDKGRYRSYVISYYIEGTRKQLRRATLTDAKREANLILTNLANGEPDVLALTSTDRLIYLRACETLAKTKVPLDVAVNEYVYALGLLNGIGTLTDAVRLFMKHHAGFQSRVRVFICFHGAWFSPERCVGKLSCPLANAFRITEFTITQKHQK
jgi:hypothetical protein